VISRGGGRQTAAFIRNPGSATLIERRYRAFLQKAQTVIAVANSDRHS
jgi:hypothetical protein